MIEEVAVGDGFLQVRVFAVSVMPPVVLHHSFNYHSRYIKSVIDSVVKQHPKNKTAPYQAASCYSLTVDSFQQIYNFPPVSVEGISRAYFLFSLTFASFSSLLKHSLSSMIFVSAFCTQHTMHYVTVLGMLKFRTR
jgi:hypothetical protein